MRAVRSLALWGLCALSLTPQRAEAESRRLTLVEAEKLAIDSSPQLGGIAVRAQAAEDLARSVRGRMLRAVARGQ